MELASTVSRLKDQIEIQIENFTKIESTAAELKRKNSEFNSEIEQLDRTRASQQREIIKLREVLQEAQMDRSNLKDELKQAENAYANHVADIKSQVRCAEMKLDQRAREVTQLTEKIGKMNDSLKQTKSNEKMSRDQIRQLELNQTELKRDIGQATEKSEDQKDRIAGLESNLHQKDVENDGLRSSYSNKIAENEELMVQLSKQEQLVHELTTELNTKTAELRRLTQQHEDTLKDATEQAEVGRVQRVQLDAQAQVIATLKAEVDQYEAMKPHPEAEVIQLNSKIEFIQLEKDSLQVKKTEVERRMVELSQLCNELRHKLKSALNQRDQAQQATNLYETKLLQAERNIKSFETEIEKTKSEGDKQVERLHSKVEILHSRVTETENYKRNSGKLD